MRTTNKKDDELRYTLDKQNGTATLRKAYCLLKSCIIPEIIIVDNHEYRVTSIASYAFNGCKWLKKLDLPNSICNIGDYAFRDCRSLNAISLPETVIQIGSHTFENCYSLKMISSAECL